jgi:hypothetical protein
LIRRFYYLAEGASKDTPQLVSMFADGGYFWNVADGSKYYGADTGIPVDVYATAFPDIHRELDSFYFDDNVIIGAVPQRHPQGRPGDFEGHDPRHREGDPRPLLRRVPCSERKSHLLPLLSGRHHYSGAAGAGLIQ